jgi:hypothetical protein
MIESYSAMHQIKLMDRFVRPVLDGRKRFEVRKDDRHYETGDRVRFIPVDPYGTVAEGTDAVLDYCTLTEAAELYGRRFRVTYVLHGLGIKEGYCVFGFEEETDGE